MVKNGAKQRWRFKIFLSTSVTCWREKWQMPISAWQYAWPGDGFPVGSTSPLITENLLNTISWTGDFVNLEHELCRSYSMISVSLGLPIPCVFFIHKPCTVSKRVLIRKDFAYLGAILNQLFNLRETLKFFIHRYLPSFCTLTNYYVKLCTL